MHNRYVYIALDLKGIRLALLHLAGDCLCKHELTHSTSMHCLLLSTPCWLKPPRVVAQLVSFGLQLNCLKSDRRESYTRQLDLPTDNQTEQLQGLACSNITRFLTKACCVQQLLPSCQPQLKIALPTCNSIPKLKLQPLWFCPLLGG